MIDKSVALRKKAILSRLNPEVMMKIDAIFPAKSNVRIPMNGEKITGRSIGRCMTSLTDLYGVNVSPRSVFVQTYATKIKKVLFFIFHETNEVSYRYMKILN